MSRMVKSQDESEGIGYVFKAASCFIIGYRLQLSTSRDVSAESMTKEWIFFSGSLILQLRVFYPRFYLQMQLYSVLKTLSSTAHKSEQTFFCPVLDYSVIFVEL